MYNCSKYKAMITIMHFLRIITVITLQHPTNANNMYCRFSIILQTFTINNSYHTHVKFLNMVLEVKNTILEYNAGVKILLNNKTYKLLHWPSWNEFFTQDRVLSEH